jgi:chromosome segregation ATPase
MKVESFRRLAFRKGWRRTPGNDGLARVAIPLADIAQRRDRPYDSPDGAQDDATQGARGDAITAEPQALGALADALRQERERREAAEKAAARLEGEVAGLKEAVRVAEDAVRRADAAAAEASQREAMLRADFQQVLGQATRAKAERDATTEAVRQAQEAAQQRAQKAEGEAAGHREVAARERAQAVAERAARQAAEAAWQAAEAELDRARGELAARSVRGHLSAAWRAFLSRRERP